MSIVRSIPGLLPGTKLSRSPYIRPYEAYRAPNEVDHAAEVLM